jgi:hypothetical protein
VLQDDRVARQELRGRDAYDLVVGEVPRLDGVDDPERLVDDRDRALARVLDFERLVFEESRAAVGEVVEDLGRINSSSLSAAAFRPATGHSNQHILVGLSILPEPESRYGLSLAHNDASLQ